MADQDDKDLDAAERALGTEPRDRESAEQRHARRAWDDRLAPLALAAPPAEPPADMFERISRDLDGESDAAEVIRLAERRVRRWRAAAIGMGGIAAGLAAVIAVALMSVWDSMLFTPPAGVTARHYVALMTPQGGGPGMTVGVSLDTEQDFPELISISPFQVTTPEGGALELWRVPPQGAPQSLGLIDISRPFHPINVALQAGDTLAVSAEPPGGSPTGTPTGPVILSGPLLEAR